MPGGHVVIAEGTRLFARLREDREQLARGLWLRRARSARARQGRKGAPRSLGEGVDVGTKAGQQCDGDAIGLFEQRGKKVSGFEMGVARRRGELQGSGDRFLRLSSQLVVHNTPQGVVGFLLSTTSMKLSLFRSTSVRVESSGGNRKGCAKSPPSNDAGDRFS